ncbi:MAG: adenylate/guanylate cyclase domain-containing protein, partial [Gaiellaceae bacterium]
APFEAAKARMLLASGHLAQGNPENAALELQAAASAFERLGAVPDSRRAREQLESLGMTPAAVDDAEDSQTRTFVFTDIVRSTSLVEAIGDHAWADVIRWHDQTLRSAFAAHRGEEVDHAGDGFFVAFTDSAAAVECAVAVQRTLSEHRRSHGFAPEVRIGLHLTDAARRGAGYRGKGVHEAARISALAEGGEILASAKTLAGKALRFPTSAARSVELTGISEPVELVSIDWRR